MLARRPRDVRLDRGGALGSSRPSPADTAAVTTTSALVGRAVELDQFNDLLTGIEDQGQAVLVHGDPGIGKSSLLHAVAVELPGHGA